MILAVEATWAFGGAGIALLEVFGTPDHHHAIIAFQFINFIQKKVSSVFGDETVFIDPGT